MLHNDKIRGLWVYCGSEIGRIDGLDCRWVADNRNIHRILVRISRDGQKLI